MTIDYDQNWMNINPSGPSQDLLLGPEGLEEHKAALDLNKLQLLPAREKPDRGDLQGA